MMFEIDSEYVTDVSVHQTFYRYADKQTLTNEELVEFIKNPVVGSMVGTTDHPEFARLREQLEESGYISVQRGWSNGDRVLKLFVLNGVTFEPGEQFPCAAAMRYHLKRDQK